MLVLPPTSSAEHEERKLVSAVWSALASHEVDEQSWASADVTALLSADDVAVGPNADVALLIDDRHEVSEPSVFRFVKNDEQPSEIPDGTRGLCSFVRTLWKNIHNSRELTVVVELAARATETKAVATTADFMVKG